MPGPECRGCLVGAGLAVGLADDGLDLVLNYWAPYDERLKMSHCESVDSSVLDTSIESWERHFAVNARAAWLRIKAFAEHLLVGPPAEVTGRIVALTSDHLARPD